VPDARTMDLIQTSSSWLSGIYFTFFYFSRYKHRLSGGAPISAYLFRQFFGRM